MSPVEMSGLLGMRGPLALILAVNSFCARGGPPNYDAFSDRDGHIRDEHVVAAQAMVRDPEQLEIIYADAVKGNARAAQVFHELETQFFPDIGREVAERTEVDPVFFGPPPHFDSETAPQ